MRRRIGSLFILIGVCLLLLSGSWYQYNREEGKIAGEEAEATLEEIQERMNEAETQPFRKKEEDIAPPHKVETTPPAEAEKIPDIMKIMEIDGFGYIGYLKIPDLDRELPVMDVWNYPRLRRAPCRQSGTVNGNNLIIAGHNYEQHFGTLKNLTSGAAITFTDVEKNDTNYTVDKVEILSPDSMELVENSGYDLVLYTCTYGGASRVTVFCRKEKV